ncbi:hypothetical protein LOZ53_000978 [Ophidiomyces ophidiicola]|nr:hypothetical protein LOZ53_000978 [Ophidiomyces ophidiicola]
MLTAESARKRMGVYLEDWDLCFGLAEGASFPRYVDLDTGFPSMCGSLVPSPLCPHPPSTTSTVPSPSPPLSPTPTVFASFNLAEPIERASGSVSRHRYRKSLSHSGPDSNATHTPPRSLKRKPKALNLNIRFFPRTPPSPPPTPSNLSLYSSFSDLPESPDRSAGEPDSLANGGCIFGPLITPVSATAVHTPISAPESPLNTETGIDLGETRRDSNNFTLRAISKQIRHIPSRIFYHNKHPSETIQTTFFNFQNMEDIPPPLVRSHSVDGIRYRTPSRALFADFETAHSSITSRFNGEKEKSIPSSPDTCEAPNMPQESSSVVQGVDNDCHIPINGDEIEPDDISRSQSSRVFILEEPNVKTIARVRHSLDRNRVIIARHVSRRWSFRTPRRHNSQRSPVKLVKRRLGSHNGRFQYHFPYKLRRRSATLWPGNNPSPYQSKSDGICVHIENSSTLDPISQNMIDMASEKERICRLLNLSHNDEPTVETEQTSVENKDVNACRINEKFIVKKENHERVYIPEETVDSRDSTPSNPEADAHTLAPPNPYRPGNGTSSPNFSRPIPPGKWFSRRFSPFKPIGRANPTAPEQGDKKQATVQAPARAQSDKEAQRENKRSILRLLSRQSESVNREIERGLFHDRSFGSDSRFDDEEIIDLGPGSSQSSSTQHFSQHTSSSINFPSPLRISSAPTYHLAEQRSGNPFFHGSLGTHSLNRRSENLFGRKRNARVGINKHAEPFEGDNILEEDGIDHDWETVAGSQQFTSGIATDLGHADTEGSLADYSSCGSLVSAPARPPLRSPRVFLPSSSHKSDTVVTPNHAGRYSHYFHKDPATGQYVLLPNTNYRHSDGSRVNAFSKPVPALIASTSRCPTPLPNQYKHPTPLNDLHTNPFVSTPPPLQDQLGEGDGRGTNGSQPGPDDRKSSSHASIENKHGSHRGHKHVQRDLTTPVDTRTSFQHWFSEIVARDPALRSSQASTAPHAFGHKPGNIGLHSPVDDANSNDIAGVSTTATDNNPSANPYSLEYHPCFRPCPPTNLPRVGDLPRENSNAPSRSLSTDHLLPPPPAAKSPSSLYNTIRYARDRVLGNGPKQRPLDISISQTESQEPPPRPASTGILERHLQRHGTSRSSTFTLRSTNLRTPMPARHSSTRQSHKRPKPDDLLRERLEQMDPALLADFCLPSPNSRIPRSTWEPRLSPTGSNIDATLTRPATVVTAPPPSCYAIDEESGLPTGVQFDHAAFPDTPRLNPTRKRAVPTNLVEQRRLGRRVILFSSLLAPIGWILLAVIGFGGGVANILMRWISGGAVDEFHAMELRLARRLSVAYAATVLLVVVVVLMVCLVV